MNFTIRRVKQGDAPSLAMIQTSSWRVAFKGILSEEELARCTNLEKVTAMYSRLLNENIGNGYIGELDGMAHCIAYWDKTRDSDMEGFAELICIHSLPKNWRRGCGSRMMDRVIGDIAEAGYKEVMLWVFAENKRARAFYEKVGFTVTEKRKVALGAEEICYVKEL